jgi:alpha-glucoside transport system substrate-binding protein
MTHRLRRAGRALTLIAAGALLLAGCSSAASGGGSGSPSGQADGTTSASADAASGSATGGGSGSAAASDLTGSIRVVSNWTGEEGKSFQAVVDHFSAQHPGAKVNIDVVPFDQTQAMLTQQFASGNAPDVSVALPGIVRQFSAQGLLMNLDDLWDGWIADGEYNDSLRAINAGSDGHTDAVFFKGNVNALIWYNTSVAKKYGITSAPTDWDGFIKDLDTITQAGVAPFAVGAKDVWVPTQWVDPIILRVAGIDKYTALQQGKIGWDDPAIVKAFTVLGSLIKNYWPSDALGTAFNDETCQWVSGKHVFANNGAFVNGAVASCDKNLKAGAGYTFFLMPKYDSAKPNAQAVSGDIFIGNKDTKNPALTKAFLKYLGSVDAQSIWAKRGGYIAPNMKVPTSVYPTVNDQQAAALWPKDSSTPAGYDLDDWIGGEIQVKYRQALDTFVENQDVKAFISTMTSVDTRSAG